MRSLTILVDMDDTVENLLESWVDYLNKEYGTAVKVNDIVEWDMAKAFPTIKKEKVFAPLYSDELWHTVKPKKGAAEALEKLKMDGHQVFIVSSSAYETLATKMEAVLFHYFPFVTWDDVIITSHKQLIMADVLIDDGVHNLIGGKYHKILMDAPHNRNFNAEENGMLRVRNWDEAYTAICSMAK